MIRGWKPFSIFAVVVLIFLLVPAVMLTPVGSVAANGGVVQEVEATFTYSEDNLGEWWKFTAGSQGIDPAGLCLAQYSRPIVVKTSALANCGFRNYTDGSGTAAGDLTGTVWVSWLTVNFSQRYTPGSLRYHDYGTSAHFGWMAGRARFSGTDPTDNFTFVFVLDFDSDADMTNADGKGFLLSIEENGDFAGHKIIGDFDVLIENGADYTWDLHLRNYDPSEVYDLGNLNVTGQVLQEPTDAIRYGLDLLSFNVDGPTPTQTVNHTTDFEEIVWGREPYKSVTSGHLGTGGLMDLSRNDALYLHIDTVAHPGETWTGIQGTAVCNLYIDDTYTQTGDDGSSYGKLWELLLLDIPFQYLQMVAYPYNFFNQLGYTFTPFGMFNLSTDCYAGTESYADAQIFLEATAGTAHQYSTDHAYGLYPHPKVESVFPSNGFSGTTMDVKISGKYFLRAAGQKSGEVPNSGSVDFGPGIAVIGYTIDNPNSPIDNSITASITIAANATPGARVVNVTSCFGYSNGNGTAPYLSGTGVFNVVTTGATLNGSVTFPGRVAPPDPAWAEGVDVKAFEPGNLDFEVWSTTSSTNDTGVFSSSGLLPETYDIGIKNWTCLSKLVTNVTLTGGGVTAADFGSVKEGDSNGDDLIGSGDFSLLSFAYNTWPAGPPKWNPNCDFDRDNYVGSSDFSLLSFNYNDWGDAYGYF